ncbi:DNA mismatch repair protein MutS [Hydrogenobacter thermophilus]|uniref:DNA mismatch repair protein MutS n=1 Tax=Hydrogenobacter thermophilus TaxID=940 RepID=UPI0030F9F269
MWNTQNDTDLTPMLSQYHHFKRLYPDCLLLFRLGDFYELFYDDALIGSKELGLVLTSRPSGKGKERIPMCGVPYHSSSTYITRLVSRGYKIAICEQMEDASQAKGIVRREVIRVITPGTYFEKDLSGLACVYTKGKRYFCAYLNPSTGEFISGSFSLDQAYEFMCKFSPKEVLLLKGVKFEFEKFFKAYRTELEEEYFLEGMRILAKDFNIQNYRSLGFEYEEELIPCAGIYLYLKNTQKSFTPFVRKPKPYTDEGYVRIDHRARRGLELLESYEGREDISLFSVINRTLTGMGRRRLRFHILHPFRSKEKIIKVQLAVEELTKKRDTLIKIRKYLDGMPDMERLVSRISGNVATPKDFVLLKKALICATQLREQLMQADISSEILRKLIQEFDDVREIALDIDRTLVDDPPIHLREGGLIKDGVNEELDRLRYICQNSEILLKDYEDRLRKETNIQSLKIGYNRVMGYYIEVTKPNLKYVPSYFRRRQTLSNAERFTTDELCIIEEKILSAQTRIKDLEYELFTELRERVLSGVESIVKNAQAIGLLDYLQSLACLALEKNWKKPIITEEKVIKIKEGRHPLIEAFVKDYVPNNTYMDEEERIMIITGPNMAGKSSYIRQVAVLTLLAHMGSFLPCEEAQIGIVSSIHARIGSGDILALGVSTFMNEMLDVSSILNSADERSLIILDEVGRGTSTYDGISLTKALVEYIANKIKARTLLATHYLELTKLEEYLSCVRNYHMAVSKEGVGITFLYRLVKGSAEGSFGIEVAKMAGLPEELIKRAREILSEYESAYHLPLLERVYADSIKVAQEKVWEEVLEYIESVDIANTTPLQALLLLAQLKEKIRALRDAP